MRVTIVLLIVLATLGIAVLGAERGATQPIAPRFPAMGPADAGMGGVRGKVTCLRPRPKQEIVVYLVREGGELPRERTTRHTIGQRGARFAPAFLAVVAGDRVAFVNDEDKEIDHNVYGLGSESFDLGIFPKGVSFEYAFHTAGEVSLHCSVHKMMDAKVFVAPSPAFAVLEEGADTFAIDAVPAGAYRLRTYQRAKRFRDDDRPLTVREGETVQVEVELSR